MQNYTANLFGTNFVTNSTELTLLPNSSTMPAKGLGLFRYYNDEIQISNNGEAFFSIPTSINPAISAGTNISLDVQPTTTVINIISNPSFSGISVTGLTTGRIPFISTSGVMTNTNIRYDSTLSYVGIGGAPSYPFEVTGLARFNTGLFSVVSSGNLSPAIQAHNTTAATSGNFAYSLEAYAPNIATGSGTDVRIGRADTHAALLRYNYTSTTATNNTLQLGIINGTFPAMTISSNAAIVTASTVNGRNMTTDGSSLDTLISRVNQAVNTSSTPTFAGATISGNTTIGNSSTVRGVLSVYGNNTTARVQLSGSDSVNATWRIATPTTKVIAFGGNSDHNIDLGFFADDDTAFTARWRFSTNGRLGIGTTLPAQALDVVGNIVSTGTVNGRNIATDGSNLDTLVSRVGQAVNTTSSPTFAGATLNGITTINTGTSSSSLVITNSNAIGASTSVVIQDSFGTGMSVTSKLIHRIGRSSTFYGSMSYLYGNITTAQDPANRVEFGVSSSSRIISLDGSGRTHIGGTDMGTPGQLSVFGSQGTAKVQLAGTDGVNSTWRIATPSTKTTAVGTNDDNTLSIGGFDTNNTVFTSWMNFNSTGPTIPGSGILTGARYQLKNGSTADAVTLNSSQVGGTIKFASNGTEFITMGSDSIYVNNLRAFTSTVTLKSNMPCDAGILIDGRDISVDGAILDTLNGRVNQAVNTTSSPTFTNVTVTNTVLSNNQVSAPTVNVNSISPFSASWVYHTSQCVFRALADVTTANTYLAGDNGLFGPAIGNNGGGIGGSDFLWFFGNNGSTGRRYYQLGSTAYFTGQHASKCDDIDMSNIMNFVGLIVCATGEIYDKRPDGTVITGANAITICESLPKVTLSTKYKQKTVFGVVSNVNNWNNVGIDDTLPDWNNGLGDKIRINSIGEGAVWIISRMVGDIPESPIENGDYFCSSDVPGYGIVQDDDILHSYTVGKVTCDCFFELNTNKYVCHEFDIGQDVYRCAFMPCTYHCG